MGLRLTHVLISLVALFAAVRPTEAIRVYHTSDHGITIRLAYLSCSYQRPGDFGGRTLINNNGWYAIGPGETRNFPEAEGSEVWVSVLFDVGGGKTTPFDPSSIFQTMTLVSEYASSYTAPDGVTTYRYAGNTARLPAPFNGGTIHLAPEVYNTLKARGSLVFFKSDASGNQLLKL